MVLRAFLSRFRVRLVNGRLEAPMVLTPSTLLGTPFLCARDYVFVCAFVSKRSSCMKVLSRKE